VNRANAQTAAEGQRKAVDGKNPGIIRETHTIITGPFGRLMMRVVGILLTSTVILSPFLAVAAQPAQDIAQSASTPTPDSKVHALIVERAAQLRAAWAASGPHPSTVIYPSVTSGRILTPSVDVQKAPGQAIVRLTIASGLVGASSVSITLTSPSGKHAVTNLSGYLPAYPVAAKQTFDFLVQSPFANGGLGPYSESGPWKLTQVMLTPDDGNFITYSGDLLTVLFPSLTVNVKNANPADITPPTFGVGKIMTPAVSLSAATPVFAVRLPVADDLSGVTNVSISILPPGATFPSLAAYAALTAPARKASVVASMQFNKTKNVPGIYTINSISVCDFASNCREETAPAAIRKALGARTFRVTE
jgi:hypothetical protein